MQCELNLTEKEISALVSYLHTEKYREPYLPDEEPKLPQDELPQDEMEVILILSELHEEDKNQIRVFGDSYKDVYNNARKHILLIINKSLITPYKSASLPSSASLLQKLRSLSPLHRLLLSPHPQMEELFSLPFQSALK